jgi:cytosine deaminase
MSEHTPHEGAGAGAPVDLVLRRARPMGGDLADVAVHAGSIIAMGADLAHEGRDEIDLGGAVVLPGFVDVHHHIDKAFTVDVLGPADGLGQAVSVMRAYKAHLSAEDISRRARAVLDRVISHGTCALRTHVDVDELVELRGVEGVLAVRGEYADRVQMQVVPLPRGEADLRDPAVDRLLRRALEMGCDGIGGVPDRNPEPRRYVDAVLALAKEYGRRVDLHVEENCNPDASVLEYVAEATLREGLEGRVTCSHCCSLSAVSDAVADRVIAKLREARIAVCALPLTNLFLQGGGGRVPGPRGMTRVRDLWEAGVTVCCASDNIQDPFNPYGNGDPLLAALVGGLVARVGSARDQATLLGTITTAGATVMGLADYGLAVGARADLVALECEAITTVLAEQPARKLVLLGGRPLRSPAAAGSS